MAIYITILQNSCHHKPFLASPHLALKWFFLWFIVVFYSRFGKKKVHCDETFHKITDIITLQLQLWSICLKPKAKIRWFQIRKEELGKAKPHKSFSPLFKTPRRNDRYVRSALQKLFFNKTQVKRKKQDPKHQGVQYLNYFMVMLGKQQQNNFVVWLLFSRQDSFVKLHEREQKCLGQDL